MPSAELRRMAEFYREVAARLPAVDLPAQRDIVERLHLLASEPEGVSYVEVDANGVPALLCIPEDSAPDRILLHSHSGGAVLTSMHTDRKMAAHIAKKVGAQALVVDYRLAPEHRFPAQIDDVETSYRWLLERNFAPRNIVPMGHSIGGNYAVNLALTLLRKGGPLPGAILSVSPWFDMEVKHQSIIDNDHLDMQLNKDVLLLFGDLMLQGTGIPKNDPRINLMYADARQRPRYLARLQGRHSLHEGCRPWIDHQHVVDERICRRGSRANGLCDHQGRSADADQSRRRGLRGIQYPRELDPPGHDLIAVRQTFCR